MNVGGICNRSPVTIRKAEGLDRAAELMRDQHVGYLVVVQPHVSGGLEVIGVLTDRDIVVSVVARQADPRALTVGDVMTCQPVVVDASSSAGSALNQMRRIGTRRVPVVSATKALVGVLSLDDILKDLSLEMADVSGTIQKEQTMERALRP